MRTKNTTVIRLSNIAKAFKNFSIRAYWHGEGFSSAADWQESEIRKKSGEKNTPEFLQKLENDIAINDQIRAFKPVDASILPRTAWFTETDEQKKSLKPLISINNDDLLINADIAAVLNAHALGQTQISPLTIYDTKGEKVLYDNYYYFNLAECRRYFIPELSEGVFNTMGHRHQHHMFGDDKIFALSTDALSADVDIWHDPYLIGSIFLSPRLYAAFKAEKLDRLWKVEKPCKLVDAQADQSLPRA